MKQLCSTNGCAHDYSIRRLLAEFPVNKNGRTAYLVEDVMGDLHVVDTGCVEGNPEIKLWIEDNL